MHKFTLNILIGSAPALTSLSLLVVYSEGLNIDRIWAVLCSYFNMRDTIVLKLRLESSTREQTNLVYDSTYLVS